MIDKLKQLYSSAYDLWNITGCVACEADEDFIEI